MDGDAAVIGADGDGLVPAARRMGAAASAIVNSTIAD
jgi:hypothetical protein